MRIGIVIMALFGFLGGCSDRIDGSKYIDMEPKMSIEEFFNGNIKAWGIVQGFSGNVEARFDVEMVGKWDGNQGVLDEVFTYYDTGKVQYRTWNITKLDDLTYQGGAGDIIGTANGTNYGNAIKWEYEMDVPVDDKTYRLTFKDWMWAMNGDVVINRSYLKKFGITVAEITIFMQKVPSF